MERLTIKQTAAGLLAGLMLSAGAMAAPMLDFETSLENSTVDVVGGWDLSLGNLELGLSSTLADNHFSLTSGESHTFHFFNIKLPALGVGNADISATLAFLQPEETSGIGNGSAFWISQLFFSAGELMWENQPGLIELAGGDSFYLAFSDLKGIQKGKKATVTATVTAKTVNGPVPVPEPATLALMGMALLGLGASRRRRLTAAA